MLCSVSFVINNVRVYENLFLGFLLFHPFVCPSVDIRCLNHGSFAGALGVLQTRFPPHFLQDLS